MRALSRHAALPADHGSWVFLLVPLVVGLVLGGTPTAASGWLVLAALAGFLLRQPLTLAARIAGGRRPRSDLAAVGLWGVLWGSTAAIGLAGLVATGRGRLGLLALPAVPLLLIQLRLVARRADRRRPMLEVAGAAALTLSAPAALWCGSAGDGPGDARGWVLWLVLWLQAAASLLHVHALLVRRGGGDGATAHRVSTLSGWAAPAIGGLLCGLVGVSPWVGLALLPQAIENLRGAGRALQGVRPAAIGLRQAGLTMLCAVALIAIWTNA